MTAALIEELSVLTYGARDKTKGGPVSQAQDLLKVKGYPEVGISDGIWGPKMDKGFHRFQTDNRMVADGVLDSYGWALLRKAADPIGEVFKGRGATIIPFAVQYHKKMKVRGTYDKGYPKGAIVHFTAGRWKGGLEKAKDSIEDGISNGYTYLCISYDGQLVQAHPVNGWGHHAGESAWARGIRPLVGSVSDDLIGFEMNCAGKLEETKDGRLKSWYGEYIDKADARYVTEKDYGCPTGWYHKYTPEQEAMLIKSLLWLKANDPVGVFNFDSVLGHHEVAGKLGIGRWRKNDPGGSLSMTMDKLRALLKSQS